MVTIPRKKLMFYSNHLSIFAGAYSLTVKYNDPAKGVTAKHYRIRNLDNGGFYISTRITFNALEKLVAHYMSKNLKLLLLAILYLISRVVYKNYLVGTGLLLYKLWPIMTVMSTTSLLLS